MSRSNPNKLKPACPKQTIFIFGEGSTEQAFLKHLMSIYSPRYSGISVKILSGDGGGPDCIVDEAIKYAQIASYDYHFALLDTVPSWTPQLQTRANKNKFHLFGSTPNIEGLFLNILEKLPNPPTAVPEECKKAFHRDFLDKRAKLDFRNYLSLFSKGILEKRRTSVAELDSLIKAFTNPDVYF